MLTIGLTGPTGAGKGTVASLLAKYGIPSIDTDAVYRELLVPPSPLLEELAEAFGSDILTPTGELDRAALAPKVFAPGCEAQLETLNAITHPHILGEVRRRLSAYAKQSEDADGPRAVAVDAPQLFESGFNLECDVICSVLAPKSKRLSRIMERDGISEERAKARMNAQRSDSFYRKAGYVIVNNGDMEQLDREVSGFCRYVRQIGL
jgi:dephospho-CoA kinase